LENYTSCMFLIETFYHIYNRANGDENLFRNDKNYNFFLKRYAEFIYPVAETFAYCLLPNHFHFLIKTRTTSEIKVYMKTFPKFETLEKLTEELSSKFLSKQFSNLFSAYTQSFNKVFNRNGSLFQKNFKHKAVGHNTYFANLIHYIHGNPVHHGFCKRLEDWPHTSYESIVSDKKTLLNKEQVVYWFGSKAEYIESSKSSSNQFSFRNGILSTNHAFSKV